ncbi:MAG: SLC13 family permease [Desulfobacterales bacterium]|nr:SLC13 family permease [Desulfobacterales bacterium]MDJ0915057.1 SLC13 family permease [Desulfobacterales bacterium]
MEIWIVTIILLTALFLLISEKISVDLTATGIMVALMLSGVLSAKEAVAGFANPAVITVASMFLISRGMIRTGSVEFIAQKVIDYSRGNRKFALITVLLTVALSSAFLNNTPVVVLFIPIVLRLSCEYEFSPSKFLIPISYASILAGTCTLLGTSTNIIVSDLSDMYGYGALSMFELSSLGVPIAVMGVIFLYFASPYIMPDHTAAVCEIGDREDKRYLAELQIQATSPLIGHTVGHRLETKYGGLDVLEVIRHSRIMNPTQERVVLAEGDLLLVKGTASDLFAILQEKLVELPHSVQGISFGSEENEPLVVELIVPPQSSLLGHRLLSTELQGNPNLHIIAVKSRKLHYSEQKIQNVRLRIGDIILAWCPKETLNQLRTGTDFIIAEDVHHALIDKRKARWSTMIFAAIIIAATAGLADIMTCAVAGVFFMAVSRCFRLRDAYRVLQPEVLLLIVGSIALGTAMEKTGASRFYAEGFLNLFADYSPRAVLAGFLLLTSISTQLLSNNATAVLLMPVAVSSAISIGIDPKPLIIAVCFGASACFASPIGYQTNLLVYGPGGYRFSDYFKLGIPLNILVIVMGTIFIPMIWPF